MWLQWLWFLGSLTSGQNCKTTYFKDLLWPQWLLADEADVDKIKKYNHQPKGAENPKNGDYVIVNGETLHSIFAFDFKFPL